MKLVRFYTDESGSPLESYKGEPWHIQITNRNGDTTLCGIMLDGSNNYAWHVKEVTRTRSAVCPMCMDLSYHCRSVKVYGQDCESIDHKHGNTGKKRSPETVAKIIATKKKRNKVKPPKKRAVSIVRDCIDGKPIHRSKTGNST